MTPAHVLDQLDDYLDAELPARDLRRIRAHLAACAACAAEYHRASEAIETIRRRLRQVAVPVGLRARLAVALRELSPSHPH